MITLPNGTAIEAGTTTATTVVATIIGMELDVATPPNGTPVVDQGYIPIQASAAALYTPSGVKSALISNIMLFNTGAAQVVNLYIGGVAAANQIASLSIPANGWAQYEDGDGWTIYTSNGVPQLGAGLITASAYIGSTVALTAATFINVESISLSAGTWLIYGTILSHLTTATLGHMDIFLGPNSASKTAAYAATSGSMGNIAGGTEETQLDVAAIVTLTGTTTVFLEAYCSETSTAEPTSTEQSVANVTGILAIKIG